MTQKYVAGAGDVPVAKANEGDDYARKAVIASTVGYALDGFDLLILGFILAAISADLGLSSTQAGSLVTWTLVGAVVGGIVFGWLSDKFGRVRVLKSPGPYQVCMRAGWLRDSGESAVCLPNQVVVQVTGPNPRFDSINF